jgi:hypothetical protein
MTKSQAREKLAEEITRLTGQITEDGSIKSGTVTFGWFVGNLYRGECQRYLQAVH